MRLFLLALALVFLLPAASTAADLSPRQEKVFGRYFAQGAKESQKLTAALGSSLKIRTTRSSLGGGYYTETLVGSKTQFTVYIHRRSLRSKRSLQERAWDRHMIWHELGHVITNAYFDMNFYERAFRLFARHPNWQNCFLDPTADGCVHPDEILADQLAFWTTGKRWARSPRNIPPLFKQKEFRQKIIKPLLKKQNRLK